MKRFLIRMPSPSRIGNSIFFIGLMLSALAAIVFSASDGGAGSVAALIGGVSLLLMMIAGWLWTSADDNQGTPLSRQSPRVKLLSGIPGLVLILLPMNSVDRVQRFLGFALLAVAFAGALELLLDRKFPSAKGEWERLHAWKKVGLSTVVIVAAFSIFGATAMLIAKSL
jgi:hypothetical protein